MELVSILVPNYNYERYLSIALDSAVNQNYENIEIIIVDDGSTDSSVEIAKTYEQKYKNVKLYINEQNLGPVGSHNRAIELSNGEYLVVLSSDDYLEVDFVKKCMDRIRKYPKVGMVVSATHYVDADGNVTDPENYYAESFMCKGIYQCKVFLMSNTFVPSQVLFRKECILNPKVGGAFCDAADTSIDTELWFRICLYYDFLYFTERLCFYRTHIGSFSKSYDNLKGAMQYYLLRQRFIKLAKENEYLMGYAEEAMKRTPLFCIRSIHQLLLAKDFKNAKRYLRLAQAIDPDLEQSDYCKFIENILKLERVDNYESYQKVQGDYLDSLKGERSKMVTNTAPYALPERAVLLDKAD